MPPAGGDADLLQFDGEGNHTAATLSVQANERDIHVATVQENRLEGGTDTVVYTPLAGVRAP